MKKSILLLAGIFLVQLSFGQLMMSKSIGKNSSNSKMGFGTFAYYEFPLNSSGNKSFRLELLDLAFFPPKDENVESNTGYISIKAGYKKIFSDSRTGFYIEPQAGYCKVVPYKKSTSTQNPNGSDGIALAFETGYNLGVGKKDNAFTFGIKYENDISQGAYALQSIGLRVAFSFHLF